jgi:hypothetical protein
MDQSLDSDHYEVRIRAAAMKSLTRHSPAKHVALLAFALAMASAPTHAADVDPGPWSAGIQARGFTDFEPGNDYVTGFDAGYAPDRVLGVGFRHRLELRAAWLTSRAEAAYRNVLRQDWFLFSPVWHFRRQRLFDPTLQLDFGWQRYDVENEAIFGDLENSAVIKGLQIGFQLNFKSRYAVRYAFGYQTASTASSVVYPLPFTLGLAVTFP